jgi:hypothetical protein
MSQEGQVPVTPEPQEPLDRKEVLREQFDKAEVDASEPRIGDNRGKPAPAAADPVRDKQGKFAPKDAAAPAAPQVPVEPQPWAKAPKSWKKEFAEGWTKLDPAYQQYVHERESQMKASVDPLIPKAELADQINQVAAPYMNTIHALGIDLPTAVGRLMQIDNQLRTLPYQQKLQVLAQVAQAYGVDLSGQVQVAQQSAPPQLLQQLQNKMMELEGRYTAQTKQQEAEQLALASDQILQFSKTAEYFDDLKPVMAQLLQNRLATTLEDAYDKALRLNTDLFDQVQSARQAAADADKRKTADEAAKRARAAAVSVKSATPGTATNTKAQDRRSVLREQFDSLSERL